MDVELDRKTAHTMKEYLSDARCMQDMFVWVWRELTNAAGKALAKKMLVVMTISYILGVAKPWVLGMVFDGCAKGHARPDMVIGGLALCGAILLIGQILNRKFLLYREWIFGENWRQLDKRTTELFFEKSLGTHNEENNLLNEANIKKGHERVMRLTGLALFEGTETLLGLILPFAALWLMDTGAALIMSVMLCAHVFWSLFLNQRMMKECLPIDKKWREMNRFRAERLDHVEWVKVNAKENEELGELGKKFTDALAPDRKFWTWFIEQIIRRGIVDYLFLLVIMSWGVYRVWLGDMPVGLLFPLFSWTSQIADNLWRVGHLEHEINFLTPAILAMKEALTMPKGLSVAQNPVVMRAGAPCRIEFRNVSYEYSSQKNADGTFSPLPVLKNISFTIEPGEKVAVIGASGVGKTTVMKLLLRYMDPTQGTILIDGVDLKDIDLGSWLRLIGYVPQQAQILDGTIRYNLLYGVSAAEKTCMSDEQLWRIMKLLQIDFGERLTHGLDTMVGRNGIKLSGGQAQRVMIGSAVMKDPRFMVIDEATSSLDTTTERLVQEGLEKVLTHDRGALIITHRLNTVRRICDRFILLSANGEGSKVAAIADNFEQLAETSKEFCSLARDQGLLCQ